MRFSIITITFNAERFLRATLQSVADQDFEDWEHILWDGGSTDSTLKIARAFPHVKIREGRDGGISDAMNRGAEEATGDFLIHLHADDLLAHPRMLSLVDTALKQHPETRWLYGQAFRIDGEGRRLGVTPFIPFSRRRLRKYNTITHPATVISRKLFNEAGKFRAELKYCMDYDLWLRLARLSEPYALAAPLACFREHSLSLSTSEPLGVADEAYAVRNVYLESLWERWRSYRTWKRRRKRLILK